ncbi:MAG: ribosome-associated translation inhibitor RaiA [Candidatus Moranbacteria bacterium]|nr:ribosome-associated translation inhibitor RaiA [Candidatus Moranbacteria bacterium]
MNTRFLFKGVEVNALAREYILKRLERIEKLVDPVSKFEIEVGMNEQRKFRVEVMVRTPHHLYRAEDATTTAEGSIDVVVDKLEDQIVSDRKKMKDLKREGARELKERLHAEEE